MGEDIELDTYEQALFRCLRRASRLEKLDCERLRANTKIIKTMQEMGPLRVWRFLDSSKNEDFDGDGWRNWIKARLLRTRLVPESIAHLRQAVRQMTGCERYDALLDLGVLEQDMAVIAEAAEIARQQVPKQKGILLEYLTSSVLRIGTVDSREGAVAYTKELCELAESTFPGRVVGRCWELRGRALTGMCDDFRAVLAYRKAEQCFGRDKDVSRIHYLLANANRRLGKFEESLEHAKQALEAGDGSVRKSRLLDVAETYAMVFNHQAAASRYAQASGHQKFDTVRLAELWLWAGRREKAIEILRGLSARDGVRVYYQLGELEQVEKSGNDYFVQLTQVEQVDQSGRQPLFDDLTRSAIDRLPEPTRSCIRRRLQRDDLVLHPRALGYEIRQLRVQPVILVGMGRCAEAAERLCQPFLEGIVSFHRREFGKWSAAPIIDKAKIVHREWDIYWPMQLSDWHSKVLDLEAEIGLRRGSRNRVVLVFHVSPHDHGGFRGAASFETGIGHVWVSNNRFVDKVAAHEFYHASLQLQHSHGIHSANEPRCLMTQGDRALDSCYLHPFQKALCLTPRSVQRAIHKGLKAVNQGDWPEAIEHFKAAFAEDPLYPWLAQELAGVLYREGRFPEATEVLRRHALFCPGQESRAMFLDALAFTGRVKEANVVERRWPRGDDLHSELLCLVLAWRGAGKFHRALRIAQDNLSAVRHSADFYVEIGRLRWLMRQRGAAEVAYLEAAERGAEGLDSSLALIACEKGNMDSARDYFHKGEQSFTREYTEYLKLRFALREGDWAKAKESLRTALEVSSNTERLLGWKVVLGYFDGICESETLEKLNTYGLSLEWSWFGRFWASFLKGEPDLAILRAALRIYPLNPCWNLSRYLVDRKRVPKSYFHPSILGLLESSEGCEIESDV